MNSRNLTKADDSLLLPTMSCCYASATTTKCSKTQKAKFKQICEANFSEKMLPIRSLARVKSTLLARWSSSTTTTSSSFPRAPDRTGVNVHEHKLARPERRRPAPRLTEEARRALEADSAGSLIPKTLEEMEGDAEFARTAADLKRLGQKALTREERRRRQRALDNLGLPGFGEVCSRHGERRFDTQIQKLNLEIIK